MIQTLVRLQDKGASVGSSLLNLFYEQSPSCLCPFVLQDRAERAVRYAKTQEDDKASKEALLRAKQAEQEARKETLVRERRQVVPGCLSALVYRCFI